MEKLGKGYIGKRMSVNASIAYQNDEMPISKWTKKAIFNLLEENGIDSSRFQKLNVNTLRRFFLTQKGYHHTGAFYQVTIFYGLDFDYIQTISDETIEIWIESQKKDAARAKIKREANKDKLAAAKAERELKKELKALFNYQDRYKTFTGFVKGIENFGGIEGMRRIKAEKEEAEKQRLIKIWTSQGRADLIDQRGWA